MTRSIVASFHRRFRTVRQRGVALMVVLILLVLMTLLALVSLRGTLLQTHEFQPVRPAASRSGRPKPPCMKQETADRQGPDHARPVATLPIPAVCATPVATDTAGCSDDAGWNAIAKPADDAAAGLMAVQ